MKTGERNLTIIIIVTIIGLLTFTGIFRIKAVAKETYFTEATDTAETDYREAVKDVLTEYGAKNAGITMTKTSGDGYTYNYKVAINLPTYINLDEAKEQELTQALSEIALDIENASVTFSFS